MMPWSFNFEREREAVLGFIKVTCSKWLKSLLLFSSSNLVPEALESLNKSSTEVIKSFTQHVTHRGKKGFNHVSWKLRSDWSWNLFLSSPPPLLGASSQDLNEITIQRSSVVSSTVFKNNQISCIHPQTQIPRIQPSLAHASVQITCLSPSPPDQTHASAHTGPSPGTHSRFC